MSEIAAVQVYPGEKLKYWERKAILGMDKVRLAFLNRDREKGEETVVSDRPMSSALFDAIFK